MPTTAKADAMWTSPHLQQGDRTIQLAQTSTGQGMRHLTGTKIIGSSSMFLLKAGGAFFTEGSNELLISKRLEFMPGVVRIKSQPCRLDMVIGGKSVSYTPDVAVLFDTGERAIWEIKPDWSHLQDPDYVRKLDLAAVTFHDMNWSFRTMVRYHFDNGTEADRIVNDNVDLMFVSRLTVVTESQKARVGSLLKASGGIATLGQVAAAIGGHSSAGRSCAYAMMARRLIAIDLDRPLSDASIVRSVKARPAYLPNLRF